MTWPTNIREIETEKEREVGKWMEGRERDRERERAGKQYPTLYIIFLSYLGLISLPWSISCRFCPFCVCSLHLSLALFAHAGTRPGPPHPGSPSRILLASCYQTSNWAFSCPEERPPTAPHALCTASQGAVPGQAAQHYLRTC